MTDTGRARVAKLLVAGADAVQVACALGVSLQRARGLIEEFQAPDPRHHEAGPSLPLSPAVLDALGIQLADRR